MARKAITLSNVVAKGRKKIDTTTGRPVATLHDLLIVESPQLQAYLSRLVLKNAKPETMDKEANYRKS